MTRRRSALVAAATLAAVIGAAVVFAGNALRSESPEAIALEYGRALYASDADALWRLLSDEDRRAKDQATFRRQQQDVDGFTRDALRQLARYVDATPVKTSAADRRATVTLRFRLPDANAAEIRTLMYEWDAERLNALTPAEREQITSRLAERHRQGTLPIVEGDETFDLVHEAGAWRVSLHSADGVRLRFLAAADPGGPLDVSVTPAQTTMNRGERLRVTVRATNRADHEITTRVAHRMEPQSVSKHLALLLCPLFVPVTLAPGETREFSSEYLLLGDTPGRVRALDITYVFPATAG